MRRVLFLTDFSANSWNALSYAFQFFEGKSLSFQILHIGFNTKVYNTSSVRVQGISAPKMLSQNGQENFDALRHKINSQFPKHQHKINFLTATPPFIDSVKNSVNDLEIDLIVMGTKGANGFKDTLIGSHAVSVITRVKCPTLIIPEGCNYNKPKNLVLPSDFNLQYKNKVLTTLTKFINYYNTTVNVLRVSISSEKLTINQLKNKNHLKEALQQIDLNFHKVDSINLEEGLQEFIENRQINVVAIIAKNINFFQRLFLYPNRKKISYHTKIPFLVLHE